VANQGDDTLSVYVINAATGQWLHNGYLPTGADPVAVAVSPNEKFVFVVDETDNNISVFQLDAVTGRLSFVETENTGAAPSAVAVSPSGSWLYAANTGANTISGYSTGALTSIDTDAVLGGVQLTISSGGAAPVAMVMHPTLSRLYVINNGSNTVSAFSYDAGTGALTATDVDVAVGVQLTLAVGTNPTELAIDRSGKFLFVANQNSNDVSAFSIDATTGVLTAAGPTSTGAASGPRSLTVHPSGMYVYTANGTATGTLSIFSVNATTGALALQGGSPLSTVPDPRSVRADPSGKYLFVASETGQVQQGYSISTVNGTLSALGVTRTRSQPVAMAMSSSTSSLSPQPRYAYAVASTANTVRSHSVNASSGALSFLNSYTVGNGPVAVVVDPYGRFVYTVNNTVDSLSGYSINDTTGALSRIDLLPGLVGNDLATGTDPQRLTVDPSGRFLYVSLTTAAATGQVQAFRIGADGTLTEISGSPYTVGAEPKQLGIDPTGQFLYVVNQDSGQANGTVTAFSINPASGPAGGQLTTLGTVNAGSNPQSVAIEPTGRFAYVGNRGVADNGTILSRYNIDTNGTISSPGSTATISGPVDLAMDPLGRFAYVAAAGLPGLAVHEIANSNGTLTSAVSTPTTPTPSSMEIDPSGRFAYVGYSNDLNISVYSINSTSGVLTAVSTIPSADFPLSIAITRRLVSSSSPSGNWR